MSADAVAAPARPPAQYRLIPNGDNVVIRPHPPESMTRGGLVIPDIAKKDSMIGTVIASGRGRRSDTTGDLIPQDIPEGCTVVYAQGVGTTIHVNDEDVVICPARAVLTILVTPEGT